MKELTRFRRYYTIGIFTLTAALLYADQNLMAPLLTPIAADFGFNDEEKDRSGTFLAAELPHGQEKKKICSGISKITVQETTFL